MKDLDQLEAGDNAAVIGAALQLSIVTERYSVKTLLKPHRITAAFPADSTSTGTSRIPFLNAPT